MRIKVCFFIFVIFCTSFLNSFEYDLKKVDIVYISANLNNIDKIYNSDEDIHFETVNSFEKHNYKKTKLSKLQIRKLKKILSKIFANVELMDSYEMQEYDLSFLDEDFNAVNQEKEIVVINDKFIDVAAIIYLETNETVTKIAVGKGKFLNIDGHYYLVFEKDRKKLLNFIRKLGF